MLCNLETVFVIEVKILGRRLSRPFPDLTHPFFRQVRHEYVRVPEVVLVSGVTGYD